MKQDKPQVLTNNTIGAANKNVSNYWDRMLAIDEVALLLKININDLKVAALGGGNILENISAPPCFVTETGRMMFKGRDIESIRQKLVESGLMAR